MYELYTGKYAFKRGKFAEHCRELTSQRRPEFPAGTPEAFRMLAERCWDQEPHKRPSDDEVGRPTLEQSRVVTRRAAGLTLLERPA